MCAHTNSRAHTHGDTSLGGEHWILLTCFLWSLQWKGQVIGCFWTLIITVEMLDFIVSDGALWYQKLPNTAYNKAFAFSSKIVFKITLWSTICLVLDKPKVPQREAKILMIIITIIWGQFDLYVIIYYYHFYYYISSWRPKSCYYYLRNLDTWTLYEEPRTEQNNTRPSSSRLLCHFFSPVN